MSGPFRPQTPGWFGQVNFIVGWFLQGCETPYKLFVQYAAPPALEAAIILGSLDIPDMIKEWGRPKGLRSARHGRKGNRGKKPVFDLLDPSDIVAKNTPGHEFIRGRPFGSPTFWVYEISDVFDRVGWTIFCVDMLTDIVYGGLIGIINADPNTCPNMGRLRRTDAYGAILNTHGNFAQWAVQDLQYIHQLDSPNGFACQTFYDKKYLSTLSGYLKAIPGLGLTDAALGFQNVLTGEVIQHSEIVTLNPNEGYYFSVDVIFSGPGMIGPVVLNGPNHAEIFDAEWEMSSISN